MTVVPADCTCGGNGVCLACALAAIHEVYVPEPTDEEVTRPTMYVPDSRHENDWTL